MAHEGCCEVLRDASGLKLCDEPLAGAVEHGATQFRMETTQVGHRPGMLIGKQEQNVMEFGHVLITQAMASRRSLCRQP